MNALIKPEPTTMPMAFGDMERLADAIAKSNLFGLKTREQALVLMMISHAEGRHPALAARDYDVIQNRPAKKSEAMLRDFLQAGGRVEWHALSDEIADATFIHPQGGSARIAWDLARATKAQLGGKDNWKKFPRQMLRSRVVSEGVRTVYPLATSGLYVPEEVADFNGTTLEAEPDAREQMNREVPLKPAAASTHRGERKVDPQVYEAPSKPHPQMPNSAVDPNPVDAFKPERTDAQWRVWLDKLREACAVLYHRAEVVQVAERPSVADALATGPAWVRDEVSAILAENYRRFGAEEPEGEEEAPAIAGEDKVFAGD